MDTPNKRLASYIRAGLALGTIVEKPLAVFLRPPDPVAYVNEHSSSTHYYGDVFGFALAGKFGSAEKASDAVKKDCSLKVLCALVEISPEFGGEILILQNFKSKTSAEIAGMLEKDLLSESTRKTKTASK